MFFWKPTFWNKTSFLFSRVLGFKQNHLNFLELFFENRFRFVYLLANLSRRFEDVSNDRNERDIEQFPHEFSAALIVVSNIDLAL